MLKKKVNCPKSKRCLMVEMGFKFWFLWFQSLCSFHDATASNRWSKGDMELLSKQSHVQVFGKQKHNI